MTHFVQLEQQLLTHDLQGTHLFRVLLLSQVHLSISALSDLREDLEVALPQTCPPLAQVGPFTAKILCEGIIILSVGSGGRWRIYGLELRKAILSGVYVSKKVIVVVEEV